jgi:hypothetical protein
MRSRKTLTLFVLATGLVCTLTAWAQQKPFTRNQVQGLVRDGLGDESGAKLIEQRGIDFVPGCRFFSKASKTQARTRHLLRRYAR